MPTRPCQPAFCYDCFGVEAAFLLNPEATQPDESRGISIAGWGAVSAAGWGVAPLVEALASDESLSVEERTRKGAARPLKVRPVPPADPSTRLKHPRIRRASPQVRFAAAAAIEAMGVRRLAEAKAGAWPLGIVFATVCGAVQYSNRFYREVLDDPATASPILFPETVYNSASSHLSAILETQAVNYTLVGDTAEFLAALRLGVQWLREGGCDGCLIVGSEEIDWVSGEAMQLFDREGIATEGAGALFIELENKREPTEASLALKQIVEPVTYLNYNEKTEAIAAIRNALDSNIPPQSLLVDSVLGHSRTDRAEASAWASWAGPRLQPSLKLGNAMGAGAALQAVAACEYLQNGCAEDAIVSAAGHHHQCAAAWIAKGFH
jgi:hypothetical protein